MKIAEAVSKRIRELLAEKQMSQYRLEKTIVLPHTTMTNILNAKHNAINLKTVF